MNDGTTASTSQSPKLTVEMLFASMKAVEELLKQPDPLATWMREEGFDPDRGGILVIPESMRNDLFPLFPPKYVRFSGAVLQPVLALDVCL